MTGETDDEDRGRQRSAGAARPQAGVGHYGMLQVAKDATAEEIRAAFVERAKRFHPDRHPTASHDLRARLVDAMAAINEAYEVLSDPARRAAYDRELDGERESGATAAGLRVPAEHECALCGATPARAMRFEHQHAWVISATRYVAVSVLCRSCGLAIGRSKQNRTLLTGWWGILSFFRNLLVVGRNAATLWRAGRLDPPNPADPAVLAPLPRPLPPGRVSWLRSGTIVVGVVLALALAGAASDGSESPGPTGGFESPRPTGGFESPGTTGTGSGGSVDTAWRIGSCVRGETWVVAVPCSQPHDGKIVDRARSSWACPTYTESYVEDGADVWCIDET